METSLPVEVISHIFKFLNVSDRKEASLVCESWYQASLDPALQKDLVVHFFTSVLSEDVTRRLSRRRLSHLVLSHVGNSSQSKEILLRSCENLAGNLQNLSLKGCDITETFFVKLLSQCKDLRLLDLTSCNSLFMSGRILDNNTDIQILKKSLKNVRKLNLSSIRFLSDASFNRIVTVCENVEEISLASTQITFSNKTYYPKGTTVCANSAVLTFQNILTFIKANASQIKSLNLSRTGISDDYLSQLTMIDGLHLKTLILINCKDLTDVGITTLCTHQRYLEQLDFSYCTNVCDGSFVAISNNLPQLQSLKVSNCPQITDKATHMLKYCTQLEELDLSGCSHLGSKGLIEGLCKGRQCHLTTLNLSCCSLLTDTLVLELCNNASHLTDLDLGSCFHLTDLSVHAISKNLRQLRTLRLAWCKEISDLGLLGFKSTESENGDTHADHGDHDQCRCTRQYHSNIFKKPSGILKEKKLSVGDIEELQKSTEMTFQLNSITGLKTLDLMACSKLTDTGLRAAVRFTELQVLKLSMIHSLTDAGVIAIAEANPSLEEVHLAQCANITDASIKCLTKRCSRLHHLNISSCDQLTSQSIKYIKEYCQQLHHLDVSFCNGIEYDAVETLESGLKSLHSVHKRLIGGAC
ncbi:F-box/LRR-repeat protein 2-like [Gigantopelta aegis]|uniref:F-box/LRR-repeat protein 2-like n=1 Tax=Gigantopelta aegis TaxID=1735272 RepID=UPI001B88E0D8|nr:F-box/LRR-repeat protein 2-like [Gigantopelta aegis]